MTTRFHSLRTAFVGAGAMAQAHLAALRRIKNPPRVLGVFDPDRESAAAFAALGQCATYGSLDDMLATLRPDVVHICTPAGMHFDAARRALMMGAHIYVEKPFVETVVEARELLALAQLKQRLVCCGHQVLMDPAYEKLRRAAVSIGPLLHTESRFFFNAPDARPDSPPAKLAAQLLDILPHPLYTLIETLEWMAPGAPVDIEWMHMTPTSVEATLSAGNVTGRLHVGLRARPVAASLSVTGESGALTADFIRGTVTGTKNPGTTPIEKVLNPVIEGARMALDSGFGVLKRYLGGGSYPGLAQLLNRFYEAVAEEGESPLAAQHIERVAQFYEDIAMNVRESARVSPGATADEPSPDANAPVVVLTGAAGFLGRAASRALAERGYRVRGVGRGVRPADVNVAEWIRADLSAGVPDNAFADAVAVVHAAAATSGGFAAHKRHSIDASRNVIEAAARSGVRHVVHISSLSVVKPPSSAFEVQDEMTGEADNARALGPYTWGKSVSEQIMRSRGEALGVRVKTIRPAALIDWESPELPGLIGKRLFGRWHLGLGRPGLPLPVCGVQQAASVIAWSVAQFDSAPGIVNLMDPNIASRGELIRRMRRQGFAGRMIWVPISFLAAAMISARGVINWLRGATAEPLAVWQILRPRRFHVALSSRVLSAAREKSVVAVVNPSVV